MSSSWVAEGGVCCAPAVAALLLLCVFWFFGFPFSFLFFFFFFLAVYVGLCFWCAEHSVNPHSNKQRQQQTTHKTFRKQASKQAKQQNKTKHSKTSQESLALHLAVCGACFIARQSKICRIFRQMDPWPHSTSQKGSQFSLAPTACMHDPFPFPWRKTRGNRTIFVVLGTPILG